MEKRQSNLDLLRIFAAIGVTLIHYHDECAALQSFPEMNMVTLLFIKSIGICSVNIFLLMSGYFLINNDNRKLGKIVALLLQVSFFNILFMLGRHMLDGEAITIKNIVAQLIPVNYFIVLYAALYLISPFVNKLLRQLSSERRVSFLILIIIIFSIYPTILDFTQEIRGEKWWGLSTIGAWGNQQGFNIVNFVILYCVGAVIKLNGIVENNKCGKIIPLILCVTILLVFCWAYIEEPMTRFGMRSAWCYHNPLVIAMAVMSLIVFSRLRINSKFVSNLGGAAFTSYLLNDFMLKHSFVSEYATKSPIILIAHFILVASIIYIVAFPLHKLYWLLARPIENYFNKIEIKY